jgi:FkbM family methyltransferase
MFKQYILSVIYKVDLLNYLFFRVRDFYNQNEFDKYKKLIKAYPETPKALFIDCGANLGDSIKAASDLGFRKIIAFEPNPFCFNSLCSRYQFNKKIVIIDKPVWDKVADVQIFFPTQKSINPIKHSASTTLIKDNMNADLANSVLKKSVHISEYVFSLNERVNFLKIDIEGAEIDVMNDLLSTQAYKHIDVIAVETHEHIFQDINYSDQLKRIKLEVASLGLENKIFFNWV